MPTIKDVAKAAGVSIATVSYVLNNKLDAVSEETRQEVWSAIKQIGYMPNVTARNLRSSQSRLIGYAWHEAPRNGYMNPILDHFTYFLAQAAEAEGYHLLTFTYPLADPLPVYDELVRTRRVDALVIASTTAHDDRIRYLQTAGVPFVSFGRSDPAWDFIWVDTDGEAGVREAVEMLIGLGHRRIAFIGWDEDSLTGRYRYQGYTSAMESAGLPSRPDDVWRGDNSEQTGAEAFRFWWNLPADERPTAIHAVSDFVALGVINEAERQGVQIGREMSLVGFDNLPLSQYLHPALTTLEQPIQTIAREVIDRLICAINRTELTQPRQLLVPPRLIVRASVGAPA